jgi:imidazolonepropionase-like amidohydrolase
VSQAKVKDVLDQGLASLEIAKAAGVPMGFGTDLLGETHDQQSREFQLRGEVLSRTDVVRSATVVNARILNREGELGVIAPGALADLLVVDGNPLEDLSLLAEPNKHLRMVMKAGTEFRF